MIESTYLAQTYRTSGRVTLVSQERRKKVRRTYPIRLHRFSLSDSLLNSYPTGDAQMRVSARRGLYTQLEQVEKEGDTSTSPDPCESSNEQDAPRNHGDEERQCGRETQED
jgi:hypothetical protein